MTPLSGRERFLAVLFAQPLLQADAIVVLAGEDAEPRITTAIGLLMQYAAHYIVVTGGRSEPPRIASAKTLHPLILGRGVAPDRITLETEAQNTREQAANVVRIIKEKGWKRILLVASPYHCPRASLTFIQALADAGLADSVHVLTVPCAHSPWFSGPTGIDTPRIELLGEEAQKIEAYGAQGHVASYEQGLAYLQRWEGT